MKSEDSEAQISVFLQPNETQLMQILFCQTWQTFDVTIFFRVEIVFLFVLDRAFCGTYSRNREADWGAVTYGRRANFCNNVIFCVFY